MSWEGPAAAALRERLRETDVPPSRLRTGELVAVAARRDRARQATTTVAALAGVLALPLLYLVVPESGGPAPGASATAAPVPTATTDAACTETRLPVPAYLTGHSEVISVSRNGRYAVGRGFNGQDEPGRFWLWRDWTPVELTGLDQTNLMRVLVNSSGMAVGQYGPYGALRATLLRDGRTHQLTLPTGYTLASVLAISERGDVLAIVARTPDNRPTLAVWRGSAPASAQILWPAGVETVFSGEFATDGRVVASAEVDRQGVQVYIFDLDGTPHRLTGPGTWQPAGGFTLRGDLLYATVRDPAVPEPSASPRAGDPRPGWGLARWNLETGQVTLLYERIGYSIVEASGSGWLVVKRRPDVPAVTKVDRISPDGQVQHLPFVEQRRADVQWISSDGRTIVVNTQPLSPEGYGVPGQLFAVLWRC